MADQSSTRRRFQFSLRTLLIGVTLLAGACAYFGWQAKRVRDRRAELSRSVSMRLVGIGDGKNATTSWLRRLLGDVTVDSISMPPNTSPAELERLSTLFPEASIRCDNRIDSPDRRLQLRVR
jgi:hypothetical protein